MINLDSMMKKQLIDAQFQRRFLCRTLAKENNELIESKAKQFMSLDSDLTIHPLSKTKFELT
jgi:hypothetical protein